MKFEELMTGHAPDPVKEAQEELFKIIMDQADDLDAEARDKVLHALDTPIGEDEALTERERGWRKGLYGMSSYDKEVIREVLSVPENVPMGCFTKTTGKTTKPLNPFEFSRNFKYDVRPFAKNEARELVTYKDGAWLADDEWLARNILIGLGHTWTPERRNAYIRALNDAAETVSLGKEEYCNFLNTLVHWRTGNPVPHSPEHCGTIQLGTVWDVDAECPRWLAFLNDAVAEDAVSFLQEVFGYMLYMGGNPYRASFMLHGPSGSGKSVALNVLSALAGPENLSNRTLQELGEDRFATADLYGRLINICGDIDSTMLRETAMFKRITGGDTIRGENKGQRAFYFKPVCKMIFSANKLPGSVDVSTAWFTRWHLIHFPNGGHSKTPGFEEGLLEELPGIARWAIEGLQRLMARGGFEQPESVREAGEAYRREVDSVAAWVSEQELYPTGDPHPGNGLYMDYGAFCGDEGRKAVARKTFYSRLEELGCERVKWNGTAAYYRIRSQQKV